MAVQVGRRYTTDELAHLRATTSENELKGLVLRYNIDGTAQFVPWHQATGGGIQEGGRDTRPLREYTVNNPDFGEIEPIRKRTPAQRVDSLMLAWLEEMKKAGGFPTLQSGVAPRVRLEDGTSRPPTAAERDEFKRRRAQEIAENERKIKEIVGQAWKDGRPEITSEVVRQVAQGFLGRAETEREKEQRKHVVRSD
jgi:hypothetical protein